MKLPIVIAGALNCLVWWNAAAQDKAVAPGLLTALRDADAKAVERQFTEGADANARDEDGLTALMYAAMYGDADSVKLLLARGADPNARSRTGVTPLMLAVGSAEKVRLLLARGAEVNARSQQGHTALALRAVQLYAPGGLLREVQRSVAQARTWLWQATPRNNDEQCFQMLGVHWANSGQASLRKQTLALLAQQRPDGGWAQLPTLASDAYATGLTLVALHQAGGLPVTHPAYQRGVQYLLGTQAADGSWRVETRA